MNIGLADDVLPHFQQGQNLSYVEQAILFVEPYTSMPYPGAVKDMKMLIAGLSSPHTHHHSFLDVDAAVAGGAVGGRMGQLEKEIFRRRWGSKDNMTALSSKK